MSVKRSDLETLFALDAEFTTQRDAHYESSWKRRGGQGAYFTICRPWDRFEAIASRGVIAGTPPRRIVDPYDLFGVIKYEQDQGLSASDDGTLQACIRDLRIYMALLGVEAMNLRPAYRKSEYVAAATGERMPDPIPPAPQPDLGDLKHTPLTDMPVRLTDLPGGKINFTNLPERLKRQVIQATHDIVPVSSQPELGHCQVCGAAEIELEQFTCEHFKATNPRRSS